MIYATPLAVLTNRMPWQEIEATLTYRWARLGFGGQEDRSRYAHALTKDKSGNPYEFGVKGLAMTLRGNLIEEAKNFPSDPYGRHTLADIE